MQMALVALNSQFIFIFFHSLSSSRLDDVDYDDDVLFKIMKMQN